MRDPNRIDEFCNRLAAAWKKYPDYRFGQFMCNALGEMSSRGRDPFFPEDGEMIDFIEKYMDEMTPYSIANLHRTEEN